MLQKKQEASRAEKAWQSGTLWAAYAAVSIAAIYTHYFAFFVLAFQAGYLVLLWAGQGFRPLRLMLFGLASGAAILVAFVPWFPLSCSHQSGNQLRFLLLNLRDESPFRSNL